MRSASNPDMAARRVEESKGKGKTRPRSATRLRLAATNERLGQARSRRRHFPSARVVIYPHTCAPPAQGPLRADSVHCSILTTMASMDTDELPVVLPSTTTSGLSLALCVPAFVISQ